MPDRLAALAEMRRALRPGGRLGIAVWTEIDSCPPMRAVADALEAVVGADFAQRFSGGPWGFPDGRRLGELLEQAQLEDVRVIRRALAVTFEGGAEQLVSTLAATPLAEVQARLSPEQHRQLVGHVAQTMGDGPITSQLESNIALARVVE
jgi:SAM-dependent methyltransferase